MPDPDLTPDTIVARLTPAHESVPEDVVVLIGYVGPTENARTIIYGDPALQTHVEVPTEDIVARERLAGEEESLAGRSAVWLRRTALELDLKPSTVEAPNDLEGDFLTGDLLVHPSRRTTLGDAAEMITVLTPTLGNSPDPRCRSHGVCTARC
jgi:hypothetical protein